MDSEKQILAINTSISQVTYLSTPKLASKPVTQDILNGTEHFSNVCRTCANVTEFVMPIFFDEGLQNKLADKIHQHLPIKVSQEDVLPHVVCYQCVSTILAWHDLVECCLQADINLRQQLVTLTKESHSKTNESQSIEESEENVNTEVNSLEFLPLVNEILLEYLQAMEVDGNNSDIEYVCQVCENKPAAKTISNLTQHLQSTHSAELYSTESLQEFIKNNITFEETLNTDDQDDFEEKIEVSNQDIELPTYFCPYCDCAFSATTRLLYHINRHVNISVENGLECCGETFEKKSFVSHLQKRHVTRVLGTPYTCRSCAYTAKGLQDLQTHILNNHFNESDSDKAKGRRRKHVPADCPKCKKTFSNKNNMLVHLRSHSQIEIFSCNRCNKQYKTLNSLKVHQRVIHEGILRHLCRACGEAFPTKAARDVHARIHTGAKPFSCPHCNNSYRAKNTLDRHIDMHLNVRKYSCHKCHMKFRKTSHLTRHLNVHEKKERNVITGDCLLQIRAPQL